MEMGMGIDIRVGLGLTELFHAFQYGMKE